jgi:hypothetical protein
MTVKKLTENAGRLKQHKCGINRTTKTEVGEE